MEVKETLFMNKGDGENSYVKSAGLTEKVAEITQTVVYKAVECVLKEMSCSRPLQQVLNIADLGCSSGPNTFTVMSTVIESTVKTCSELEWEIIPEIQFYMNDLVGNDFNTLFKGLSVVEDKYKKKNIVSCFAMGAPGSFHGRLFPLNSMHLVHSSYGIHWLSKAPKITSEGGLAQNKGSIYISESSPPWVTKAYLSQFQDDFLLFLKCRSPEMVPNGRILFIINGRKSGDPIGRECIYYFETLSKAISHMVSKGLIDEEKLDSFNAPTFIPSQEEVEGLVEKEGSFTTEFIETIEVEVGGVWSSPEARARNVRAFSEPMISHHFGGQQVMDMLYGKVTQILVQDYKLGKAETKNVSIVAVLKKKDI